MKRSLLGALGLVLSVSCSVDDRFADVPDDLGYVPGTSGGQMTTDGAAGDSAHPASGGTGNTSGGASATGGTRPAGGGTSGGGIGAAGPDSGGGAPSGGTSNGGSDPQSGGSGGSAPGLLEGLVLHLKMDEDPAQYPTVLSDSSPEGNDALIVGSVQLSSAGRFGNAAVFDGYGWLSIADDDSLDETAQLTLSAWVNFAHIDPTYSHGIISKRAAYGDQTAYALFLWSEARMWVDIDYEDDRFSSLATFSLDQWFHVAVVYDGAHAEADRASLYVDGELDRTAPISSASIGNYSSALEIGRLVNGGDQMIGMIDEVAIWRRALGPDEIEQIATTEF